MITLLLAISIALTAGPKSIHFAISPGASPGWHPCAAGANCLTGYMLYETTSGKPVPITSLPQTATSFDLTPLPSIGVHTYSLVQEGLNAAGAVVQSTGNPGATINCTRIPKTEYRKCVVGKVWQ